MCTYLWTEGVYILSNSCMRRRNRQPPLYDSMNNSEMSELVPEEWE
jgi:hypothetical protein